MEERYPELRNMKANELFIEWACIMQGTHAVKLNLKRIIKKKDKDSLARELKATYQGDRIYMSTIFT
jgi:hypothetical protein